MNPEPWTSRQKLPLGDPLSGSLRGYLVLNFCVLGNASENLTEQMLGTFENNHSKQLLATDLLALATMKNAAKCDK